MRSELSVGNVTYKRMCGFTKKNPVNNMQAVSTPFMCKHSYWSTKRAKTPLSLLVRTQIVRAEYRHLTDDD